MGKPYDVIYQRDHSLRFSMDFFGEFRYILLFYHAVGKQFRIAGDALQRRFQLVGYIGREFSSYLFGFLLFGDVKDDESDAGYFTALEHRTGVELVVGTSDGNAFFAVLAFLGNPKKLLNVKGIVEQHQIFSDTVVADTQERRCRIIDA